MQLAGEGAEAALHAVADHGAADLLGDGEADADGWIVILAVADQQDEAGRGVRRPRLAARKSARFESVIRR